MIGGVQPAFLSAVGATMSGLQVHWIADALCKHLLPEALPALAFTTSFMGIAAGGCFFAAYKIGKLENDVKPRGRKHSPSLGLD